VQFCAITSLVFGFLISHNNSKTRFFTLKSSMEERELISNVKHILILVRYYLVILIRLRLIHLYGNSTKAGNRVDSLDILCLHSGFQNSHESIRSKFSLKIFEM